MSSTIHRLHFCLLLTLLLACNLSYGQSVASRHAVLLKSGTVYPTANAAQWLDSMNEHFQGADPVLALVHFNRLPTPEQRESMKQAGIWLLDYIPENTFMAHIRFPVNRNDIMAMPVYSFIDPGTNWKTGDYVKAQAKNRNGGITVLASLFDDIDPATARQIFTRLGARVQKGELERYGSYKVTIDAAQLQALAQWYGIRCISPVTSMVPLDLESRPAVKGNVAVAAQIHGGYDLHGDSVTVGVGDDASGIYHADINDRITNFNPAPLSNHGEHVNGIVGGAGNIDQFAEGMASHVSLLDFLYDLILPSTGAMYNDYHMTITNNSYEVVAGDCAYAGTYDAYSRFLDTLAIQYPEVLHVFASGNDGGGTCSPLPQGFGTIGGGYQPAKNNVVVGSMTDFYDEVSDESRGPMRDGRLKPDIEATGLIAYSTVGVDGYEWAAGTSMASPQVAGGLAILTQRYKQLNGGNQPRADLLKTVLLNGAMDLGNPGPDFSHGFGEMDINRSLKMIDNNNFTTNDITTGDSQSITINVPANTGVLKVMLCWNDVPASTSAARQLVNDLDLTVTEPSGMVHLPLVPDPTPANVTKNATEQQDHLNNVEQVTINHPSAGNYTFKVKAFSVPFGPQHYVVAYDMIPEALQLTYPLGGEQLLSASTAFDTIRIFWDAGTDGNTFKAEISPDGGATWSLISDTIPAGNRHADFLPTGLSTGKFQVRVSRNNTTETATSGRFSINARPVVTADTAQCPGYINIHWSPVLRATSYYLLQKKGFYMQVVDSTADTVFTFKDMPVSAASYVAVQPVIDGAPGYRSIALKMVANSGNCTQAYSIGDLSLDKIAAPVSGRMYTGSMLGVNTPFRVLVRDLYSTACDSYAVSWQVNAGAWQTLTMSVAIPAAGAALVTLPGLDLSATGSYVIRVAVHNLRMTDNHPGNDTASVTVLNIPNDTLSLTTPFFDGFESMSRFGVQHDSMGISPNGHWDFFSADDSGRLRSFVNDNITITGSRSVSLDAWQSIDSGSHNSLVGTFNLSNYDTSLAEIRVDFDYLLHGRPKAPDGNIVVARAADTAAWRPFYTYDLSAYPGTITQVRSLSLTDIARQEHIDFSSSVQVSFGQSDTSLIAAPDYGNGITFDNVRIYTVVNDAALVSIESPLPNNCGLASPGPLTVKVHNGVNKTLYNVQMSYTLDGGPVNSGMLDSVAAKSDVDFTFAQQISMAEGTTHSLNVWLSETGDSYTANDSILNYHFRNSQIVTSFPYLENFESGDGGYYSEGYRNSWQYGTPASQKINKAASGSRAWKTNLTGHYNNLELSYLYSPCFDLSGLTRPVLSFSTAMDIENCGSTLCDAGYVEYSYDGINWARLGAYGQGTNWYDSTFNIWNAENFTRWHVASIPIPQPGAGYTTHFRFVLSADPGVTYEGIAVDDIHVFDLAHPIFQPSVAATAALDLSGSQWADFTIGGNVLCAVQPLGQAISQTSAFIYPHDSVLYNPGATQYIFPRNYAIKTLAQPSDSVGLRLFLTEKDMLAVLADTTCPSCSPVSDAYSLGITQFTYFKNDGSENGLLTDDTGGSFVYYPCRSVKWVPYNDGYYAELNVKRLSEYWFNDGGPTGAFPAGIDYLDFIAFRNGTTVACNWHSLIDTSVNRYTVQWSLDSVNFADALDTPARHVNIADYSFNDPVNFNTHSVLYYRLQWTMTGSGRLYYSPVRTVTGNDSASASIAFGADMVGQQTVLAGWTSRLDPIVDHYLLEREIGSYAYQQIDVASALHRVGQQYSFTDQPEQRISTGTPVHYRLTAFLEDGTQLVLPEQVVEWINPNTFVHLWPNPTHDGKISINWYAGAGTDMNISLADVAGKTLFSGRVTSSQWNNASAIQLPVLPHGVYFLRMDIAGNRYNARIVFE